MLAGTLVLLSALLFAPSGGNLAGASPAAVAIVGHAPGLSDAAPGLFGPSTGQGVRAAPTYITNFSESGLVPGTNWSVTFDGSTMHTTTGELSFLAENGTYAYTVGTLADYVVSPEAGNVTVSGGPQDTPITFGLRSMTVTLQGPATAPVRKLLSLVTTVAYGLTPITYSYSGLPGGCATANSTDLNCTPTATGEFNVSVTVRDNDGRTASAFWGLEVTPPTYTAVFVQSGLLSGTQWSVSVGGRNWTSLTNDLDATLANGTYAFTVNPVSGYTATPSSGTIVVAGGAQQELTFSATVLSASLSVAPSVALGAPVTFETTVTDGVAPYTFSYTGLPPGCSSASSAWLNCTPSAAGTYTVDVRVGDATNASATASADLNVTAPVAALTASASASVVSGPAPLAVTFGVSVAGGTAPYACAWAFGDGSSTATSTPQSVTHTYEGAGDYVATVIVTDADGKTATDAVAIVVTSGPALSLGLAGSTSNGTAPLAVAFTTTVSGGSAPYTYAWSYGDGNSSAPVNGTTPSAETHTYTAVGAYLATVTVTDAAGASAQAQWPVSVLPTSATTLQAVATTNRTSATPGTPVTFHVHPSGGSGPYTYVWEFGDGTHSTLSDPSHAYAASGSYVATVIVSDREYAGVASYIAVSVGPSSSSWSLNAVATPGTSSAASEPVQFAASALGAGGPVSYTWEFGDGTPVSHMADPSHAYNRSGTFAATVTATTSGGETTSATITVPVLLDHLLLLAWASTSGGTAPLEVNFTSGCAGGTSPFSYTWSWGDGNTSNLIADNETYTDAGNYSITLLATDAAGHSATEEFTVDVTGASGHPGSAPSSGLPSIVLLGAVGAVAAVGVAATVMFGVHRRRPPTAEAPAPASAPSAEPSRTPAMADDPPSSR